MVNTLAKDPAKIAKNLSTDDHIIFKWPSLLEYLNFGSLFSNLSPFDENQPLFNASISTLTANAEKEVVFYIYDRLFAEILNQIKNIPQINATLLLKKIKEKRKTPIWLSNTLATYETALTESPSSTMHDLILYLAWDRMCVWMGQLFNYQSENENYMKATAVLKECLVESYQHITCQGHTIPGLYRMVESLLFFQMREENIQEHTDEEWAMLTQIFPALKGQNELADFFYIDDAVTKDSSDCYFTLDPHEMVATRMIFAQYMVGKLKEEIVDWDFAWQSKKILCRQALFH